MRTRACRDRQAEYRNTFQLRLKVLKRITVNPPLVTDFLGTHHLQRLHSGAQFLPLFEIVTMYICNTEIVTMDNSNNDDQ